ncbi:MULTISPECIES: cysteine hydrolase family protein [Dyella]|uniref:Cysteine hydrolase n=2 Tax=Dyella TaxID=231454 RepID=A0A4R0YZ37_9GAMM|nr:MULTISPECIES: cysteine hydrolase family protein [Dyella]TBR39739.1 cysteine hydrolase [Dyella terrae]TCI12679.1 cysteine hydrolase [Dyella soli]
MTTALLIIDIQQALCFGELPTFDFDGVLKRINALASRARELGVPVILVQHEEGKGPLQFGTDGWQFAAGFNADPADRRVRKTTPDSFHQTDLDDILREQGTRHVVVCGLQTDFCIDTSVRRGLALGYDVTLVSDGHSTTANDVLTAQQIIAHHNATLRYLNSFGGRMAVVPAGQVALSLATA